MQGQAGICIARRQRAPFLLAALMLYCEKIPNITEGGLSYGTNNLETLGLPL